MGGVGDVESDLFVHKPSDVENANGAVVREIALRSLLEWSASWSMAAELHAKPNFARTRSLKLRLTPCGCARGIPLTAISSPACEVARARRSTASSIPSSAPSGRLDGEEDFGHFDQVPQGAVFSNVESVEHAAHFAQPAFTVVGGHAGFGEPFADAAGSTARMNSAARRLDAPRAVCLVTGTNGTTNGYTPRSMSVRPASCSDWRCCRRVPRGDMCSPARARRRRRQLAKGFVDKTRAALPPSPA